MKKFKGKGVCGGLAIGKAVLMERRTGQVGRRQVVDVQRELTRLERAKELAARQLTEIYEKVRIETDETQAQIFAAHKLLLEGDYSETITNMIKTQAVNAEYAVDTASDRFAELFAAMEDPYMQARAADVRDISNRLLACLSMEGERAETPSGQQESAVFCADDLTPSETVLLDKTRVLAFVTARGSVNSHTAILAKTMDIPAVVGVGEDFLKAVTNGAKILVDGDTGEIILEPDEETEAVMRGKQEKDTRRKAQYQETLLRELKGKENVTMDGTKIEICANIGSADDVDTVWGSGADGIGLFRSEFLYLESADYPTEEQQFYAYRRVLEGMRGRKVVIRTLDVGADKQIDYFRLDKEENPALGLRAIRLCLTRPEIFRTQLRALYRASIYGHLGILFPMITRVCEVESILAICEEVKRELRKEDVPFDETTEIGIMIETPAAAIISDKLAPLVDFFSVGTNDLTQYTLAIDRQNAKLTSFCDPHHEAILRLIELSAENAHKHGVRIGICGELAADTALTETFLRMGIDELSVAVPSVLPLRDAVRKLDLRR